MVIQNPDYAPEIPAFIVVVNLNRTHARVILRTEVTGDDGEMVQRDFFVHVPPLDASADAKPIPEPEAEKKEEFDYRELYEEYGGGGD
jgi:hypothetical protein